MCFEWFSELTAIVSLNSASKLIFVLVRRCVFFAVRTEFLNTIQTIFGLKGLRELSWHCIEIFNTKHLSPRQMHNFLVQHIWIFLKPTSWMKPNLSKNASQVTFRWLSSKLYQSQKHPSPEICIKGTRRLVASITSIMKVRCVPPFIGIC
jgi:hypothetical protein